MVGFLSTRAGSLKSKHPFKLGLPFHGVWGQKSSMGAVASLQLLCS